MHPEPLLVFTLRDLRYRIGKRTAYDAIRAGGLLRQLLLDAKPLVVLANTELRRKLRFEIFDLGAWAYVQSPDGAYRFGTSTIGPVSAEASDEGFTELVSLSRLVSAPLVRWDDNEFTVGDVIRLAAHVQGGIHRGVPVGESEELLYRLAYRAAWFDQLTYHHCLFQIVRVVSDSLESMERELAAKWKIRPADHGDAKGLPVDQSESAVDQCDSEASPDSRDEPTR